MHTKLNRWFCSIDQVFNYVFSIKPNCANGICTRSLRSVTCIYVQIYIGVYVRIESTVLKTTQDRVEGFLLEVYARYGLESASSSGARNISFFLHNIGPAGSVFAAECILAKCFLHSDNEKSFKLVRKSTKLKLTIASILLPRQKRNE